MAVQDQDKRRVYVICRLSPTATDKANALGTVAWHWELVRLLQIEVNALCMRTSNEVHYEPDRHHCSDH